jgi:hypothetical protein
LLDIEVGNVTLASGHSRETKAQRRPVIARSASEERQPSPSGRWGKLMSLMPGKEPSARSAPAASSAAAGRERAERSGGRSGAGSLGRGKAEALDRVRALCVPAAPQAVVHVAALSTGAALARAPGRG